MTRTHISRFYEIKPQFYWGQAFVALYIFEKKVCTVSQQGLIFFSPPNFDWLRFPVISCLEQIGMLERQPKYENQSWSQREGLKIHCAFLRRCLKTRGSLQACMLGDKTNWVVLLHVQYLLAAGLSLQRWQKGLVPLIALAPLCKPIAILLIGLRSFYRRLQEVLTHDNMSFPLLLQDELGLLPDGWFEVKRGLKGWWCIRLCLICAQGIIGGFFAVCSTSSASLLLYLIALAKCIKHLFEVKELLARLIWWNPVVSASHF